MKKHYAKIIISLAVITILCLMLKKPAIAGWELSSPIPLGRHLHGIWGSSDTNIFAVGFFTEESAGFGSGGTLTPAEKGVILHYDGFTWSEMEAENVDALYAVWGSSANNVFAVGASGTILHYSGSGWSAMESGILFTLYGVWGSSSSDVFAVGDHGFILHYDGTFWSKANVGLDISLRAVWGSSESDVFAVGADGIIFHYNGRRWSKMDSGTTEQLFGVWGSSDADVVAVGSNGTILHYNGSAWTQMNSATSVSLYAVWGTSGANIFAVGFKSTILHYNGSAWSEVNQGKKWTPSRLSWTLYAVWGLTATDVFSVGRNDVILRYNGSTWSEVESGMILRFNRIWGNSASDVFAVGSNGTIMHHNGTEWTLVYTGHRTDLYGVWSSSGTDVTAAGLGGIISHYDGTFWESFHLVFVFTCYIRNPNTGEYDPVTQEIPILRNHYDVGGFGGYTFLAGEPFEFPVLLKFGDLDLCSDETYTVGIFQSFTDANGTRWEQKHTATSFDFYAVWAASENDAFAVGEFGTFFHYDGNDWIPHKVSGAHPSTGTSRAFSDVWGSSANDVFAVGEDGTIIHYDGNSFQEMDSGTANWLSGVWGSSASDVFAVGNGGTILHYNGSVWSKMRSRTTIDLTSVWGSSPTNVFAIGAGGAILHYDGKEDNTSPNAAFTVDPAIGGTATVFTVDASGSADAEDSTSDLEVRWDWENDGTWDTAYSTAKTATHQYPTEGTYTISLEVKDTGGLTDTATLQVSVGASCFADIECNDDNDCTDDTCEDGFCGNTCNAVDQNDPCCIDPLCASTTVCSGPGGGDGVNNPPVASFAINPSSGNVTTQFTMDASGSSDAEDGIAALEVRWDWESDGAWDTDYSTAKIVTHQYVDPGTYMVKLEVQDTEGLTDTMTRYVTVSPSICPAALLLGSNDPRLETLRKFRDRFLSSRKMGKTLVRFYYTYGEKMAAIFQKNPTLSRAARKILEAAMPTIEKLAREEPTKKKIIIK